MPSAQPLKTSRKELLWLHIDTNIWVLVPKKRGIGYLKTPYGHHANADFEKVRRDKMDNIDVFGLDGYLELCIDRISGNFKEKDEQYAAKLMNALSDYYQMPNREASRSEFFGILENLNNI